MRAAQLMADLTRLGIRLEAHGDRLRYSPRSAVTPDLAERMTAHKAELLALLRPEADPVESTDHEAESIAEAMEIIDPPDPCPECGTLELWETLVGNWRCLRCDPPIKARRLWELSQSPNQGISVVYR